MEAAVPAPGVEGGSRTLGRRLGEIDVFPEFSKKVRAFVYHPMGVLAIAGAVALVCGIFVHSAGFVLAGGVFAVLLLGLVWPWLSLRGASGAVTFDRPRVTEGEPAEATLTVRNQLPVPLWGLAVKGGFGADRRFNRGTGQWIEPVVAAIAAVPGRRTASGRWTFRPVRRGSYPLSTSRLGTAFPFGVRESARPVTVETPLLVWPKTFPVGPIPPVSGQRLVEGNVSRNKVGTNGDVLGVRPYRRGDSPRRIHWGQSARHDRLIVCELQSNSRPLIQLVLDVDPRVHAGEGSNGSREWAIRVAASFASGWLMEGAQVGLAWSGGEVPPASGQAQTARLLDALARISDGPYQSIEHLLSCPQCHGFRDGLQVIITTDRAHLHHACGTCEAEDQRLVVLKTAGFKGGEEPHVDCPCHGISPWLEIADPASAPELLRGGWREARHGS
jgi:uncharacterized protein (DUF58 family)